MSKITRVKSYIEAMIMEGMPDDDIVHMVSTHFDYSPEKAWHIVTEMLAIYYQHDTDN